MVSKKELVWVRYGLVCILTLFLLNLSVVGYTSVLDNWINTSGNVSATYFFGNGSQLTDISGGSGASQPNIDYANITSGTNPLSQNITYLLNNASNQDTRIISLEAGSGTADDVYTNISGNQILLGVITNGKGCSDGNFINWTNGTDVDCDAPAGSGDITAVYVEGEFLSGNASSGDVSLTFATGTMTDTYVCTYSDGTGFVCNTDPATLGGGAEQPNIDWSNITSGTNPLGQNVTYLLNNATAQDGVLTLLWVNASGQQTHITNLWINVSDLESRLETVEGTSYDDSDLWTNATNQDAQLTLLWSNASNQDGRLITVEGWGDWSGEGFITVGDVPAAETDSAHDTCAEISGCVENALVLTDLNSLWSNASWQNIQITGLWTNATLQDARIVALEGVDTNLWSNATAQDTHITNLWANATGQDSLITTLFTNASDQDSRIIALEGASNTLWVTDNGNTTTGDNADVYVNGSLVVENDFAFGNQSVTLDVYYEAPNFIINTSAGNLTLSSYDSTITLDRTVVIPDKLCFGETCSACEYWNGTALRRESPCTI